MACSSGCPTPGQHKTFGQCVRAKSLEIADPEAHKFHQHRNGELNEYVNARKAGLQPKTIFKNDVDTAWRITEKTGTPYRADV